MNKLAEIIKDEIEKSGPITFKRFMELSLYHEKYGYYSSGNVKIGKQGDFYTSPTVHKSFGEVICNFIAKSFKNIDQNKFDIIELGAGKGYLAFDILNCLLQKYPDIYEKTEYTIIEINKVSIKEGEKLLKKHLNKVNWKKSILEFEENSVNGVVLSNEFFDSYPFHRVKYLEMDFYELFISLNENNQFEEKYNKLSNTELIKYIEKTEVSFENNQEFEINLEIINFINSLKTPLNKAFLLTIDYGYLMKNLYSREKMEGTYKCFYEHKLSNNTLENIGFQDITSDINFSDLIQEGNKIGFKNIKYTTQGQFLVDFGILDILESYTELEDEKDRLAIKNLIMPNMMGNRFKVLVQSYNIDNELINNFYQNGELKLSFGEIL